MYLYKEIPEHEVSEVKREMAAELIQQACYELGIEPPIVQWFGEAADVFSVTFKAERAIRGAASPGKILVAADQGFEATGETVLHELKHVRQIALYPGTRHDTDERDATEHGLTAAQNHIVQKYANQARNFGNCYRRTTAWGR